MLTKKRLKKVILKLIYINGHFCLMFDQNEEVLNTSENTWHENTWAELTEVMKS